MLLKDFEELFRTNEETAFDFLNRAVPYYQSMKRGDKLDNGMNLKKELSQGQKERLEDVIVENLTIAVNIQTANMSYKLAGAGEMEDFRANAMAVCLEHIMDYKPEKAGFYSFLLPYMKSALSETIKQRCGLNRNDQMYYKRLKQVINKLSIRYSIPEHMVRKADIAFELKNLGESCSLEKIDDFLRIVRDTKNIEDYDSEVYYPVELTEQFDFTEVVRDEVEKYLAEFFSNFNEVDRFLLFKEFDYRYKDELYKDMAKNITFVNVCLNDKKASKHVKEDGVEITFMDNRKKAIKKRLKEFGDYITEEGYENELMELLKEIVPDEAKGFFDSIDTKYCMEDL